MSTQNIQNLTNGQMGYQVPGSPAPAGWQFTSGGNAGAVNTDNTGKTILADNGRTVADLTSSGTVVPSGSKDPYTILNQNLASILSQMQIKGQEAKNNLSKQGNTIQNVRAAAAAVPYNPADSTATNVQNQIGTFDSYAPAEADVNSQLQNFSSGMSGLQSTIGGLETAYQPQVINPDQTLVSKSGQPLYGLGSTGNGSNPYTNFSNLQFNTKAGQDAGKLASDIKVSSDLIDNSFQTLSNVEAKYGINASEFPDVANLNRALMSKVGGGAGAVAAFADAANSLSSAISALINNTSAFTPQEIGTMTKELNSASLNPSALQELYDTVKQTATNKYNAQIAQALYYDKLGTQSGTTNQTPVTSNSTNLTGPTAPAGFAWGPTPPATTTTKSLIPQAAPTNTSSGNWLKKLEGIPGVFGLNLGI